MLNFCAEIGGKSQGFVKISRRLVKTLRRLVKIILDFFSTKSWFVVTNLDLVDLRRSISSSAFVKIFRIFLRVRFGAFGALGRGGGLMW